MKPIRLTMQAFGSYAEKAVIDFTRANGFFLITGDTGSGKSTIFDAMMFALYGEVSSGENKKSELMSQFADATQVRPMVELVFSERRNGTEEIYTIRRTPGYMRPSKRKGAKAQVENETAELLLPDGSAFNGRLREINARLHEIIGLTAAQFRQVVMIAQGEFMDFLRAKSTEKAEQLRELLHTERYRRLIDQLQEQQRTASQERDRACQRQALHVAAVQTEGLDDVEATALEQARSAAWDGKTLHLPQMEEFMGLLDRQCASLREKEATLTRQRQDAQEKRENALRQQEAADALLVRFREMEAAEQLLAQCAAQEADMQQKQALISQIRAAWRLNQADQQVQQAQKELREVRQGLDAQTTRRPQAETQVMQAEKQSAEAEQHFRQAETERTEVRAAVKKTLDTLKAVQQAEQARNDAQQQLESAQRVAKEARSALDTLTGEEKAAQQQLLALQGAEAEREICRRNNAVWRELDEALNALRRQQQSLAQQQTLTKEKQTAYLHQKAAYEAAKTRHEQYRTAFLNAQAGLLAQSLVEGEACPVCGSRSHPMPCRLSQTNRQLNQQTLDEYAAAMERSSRAQEEASSAASAEVTRLSEKTAQLAQDTDRLLHRMAEALPDRPVSTVEEAALALKAWYGMLATESRRVQERVKQWTQVQSWLHEAQEKHPKLESACQAAEDALRQAEKALAAAENGLQLHRKALAESRFPDRATATRAQLLAEETATRIEQEKQNADRQHRDALEALNRCDALLRRYQQELPQRQQALESVQAQYRQLLQETALAEETWRRLCTQYDQQSPERLQEEISAFGQQKALATEKHRTAQQIIAGRAKPDAQALSAAAEEAQRQCLCLEKELAGLRARLQNNAAALTRMQAEAPKLHDVCQKAQWADHLYRVMNGQETGNRVDLETFVQRRAMEQILASANRRFRTMSRGQFELRLLDMDQAAQGGNKGLELMIDSLETGKWRNVNTLSGGESFMAALALALGMADQIQAATSAIHLDVMFIDEGFGSLDDQARREAVRVLQEIAGENKLIGIISHVTELKQEIDDQLLVKKTENGSRVSWNR